MWSLMMLICFEVFLETLESSDFCLIDWFLEIKLMVSGECDKKVRENKGKMNRLL
jgi:hypothetical protein